MPTALAQFPPSPGRPDIVGPPIAPALPAAGVMRVVTPDALNRYDQEKSRAIEQSLKAQNDDVVMTELARHVNSEWEMMRNHRNSSAGWSERMLHAQRCFNGQYDASQLAAIRQFKGS